MPDQSLSSQSARAGFAAEIAAIIDEPCPRCGGSGFDPHWGPEMAKTRPNNVCPRCRMRGKQTTRQAARRIARLVETRLTKYLEVRAAWGPSYEAFAQDWENDGINDDYTGPAS